jgi:hypothetical protein
MLSKVLEFEETHNGANQLRSIAGGEKNVGTRGTNKRTSNKEHRT